MSLATVFRHLGAGCVVVSVVVACSGGGDAATDEPPEENLAVVVFYEGTSADEQARVIERCGTLEGVDEVIERPAGAQGPEVGLLQDGSPFEQRLAVTECLADEESVASVYGEHYAGE